jgi:hypothetical protein
MLTTGPSLLVEVHSVEQERRCLQVLSGHAYADVQVVDPRRWLPDHRPAEHTAGWWLLDGRVDGS